MAETTDMLRVRVNRQLLAEAARITDEIGTTPGEVVRLLFKQLVRRRAIPFPLSADAPEDEAFLRTTNQRAKLWDEL
jgi:addiction module RelB/DinJ family antitoxin